MNNATCSDQAGRCVNKNKTGVINVKIIQYNMFMILLVYKNIIISIRPRVSSISGTVYVPDSHAYVLQGFQVIFVMKVR